MNPDWWLKLVIPAAVLVWFEFMRLAGGGVAMLRWWWWWWWCGWADAGVVVIGGHVVLGLSVGPMSDVGGAAWSASPGNRHLHMYNFPTMATCRLRTRAQQLLLQLRHFSSNYFAFFAWSAWTECITGTTMSICLHVQVGTTKYISMRD